LDPGLALILEQYERVAAAGPFKTIGSRDLSFPVVLLLKLFDAVAIPEKLLSLHAWASKTALAFFSAEANKSFCQAHRAQ
jgi:hypothetical protein